VADDGYIEEALAKVKCPCTQINFPDKRAMQSMVCSRHKTLNGRFKFWKILKQSFHHNIITRHRTVFWAIAAIIQVAIDEGNKVFLVEY
jgi:hypothetical protein